jgi:Ca2+/H+ antiporter, TMEM165/GDT1 family
VNFLIAATVFPIILIGELPDKTMLASLVLSTRGQPGAVWLGAALAFGIHVAIATTVGTVAILLFPHRVLEAIVAVMFLAGALLAFREFQKGRHEKVEVPTGGEPIPPWRAMATAFAIIFVAEWGDLTQVLTANLAANYHSPLSVAVGSVLALWVVAALAVVGGKWLTKLIGITFLRAGTAVVLTAFAAYAGVAAIT